MLIIYLRIFINVTDRAVQICDRFACRQTDCRLAVSLPPSVNLQPRFPYLNIQYRRMKSSWVSMTQSTRKEV